MTLAPAAPPLPPQLQGLTREEALAFVSRLFDARQNSAGLWDDPELAARWLDACSRSGSIETRNGYRRELAHLHRWLELHHPGMRLREVDYVIAENAVADLRQQVDAQQLAPRSFNRRVAAWSSLWRWASEPCRSGLSGIARSPWPRRVQLTVAKVAKPLTESDLDAVVGTAKAAAVAGSHIAHRDHALLRIGYLLGLRVSELVRLRWSDLEVLADGGGIVTVLGKGSKVRAIRISADTVQLIEALGRGADDAWIFPGRNGSHLSRSAAGDRIRLWGRRVGVKVWPHRLRHSHASVAVRRGCDVLLLARTMGHASTATTSGYVALNPNDSSSMRLG